MEYSSYNHSTQPRLLEQLLLDISAVSDENLEFFIEERRKLTKYAHEVCFPTFELLRDQYPAARAFVLRVQEQVQAADVRSNS